MITPESEYAAASLIALSLCLGVRIPDAPLVALLHRREVTDGGILIDRYRWHVVQADG